MSRYGPFAGAALVACTVAISFSLACGTQGTGISPDSWACQAFDMDGESFRSFGTSQQQAFDAAMAQCKLQSMDGDTCHGAMDKCMPPKP